MTGAPPGGVTDRPEALGGMQVAGGAHTAGLAQAAGGVDEVGLAALRDLAVAVAYRMVGSRTEAEDLAQEALIRVQPALTSGEVRSPEAYTTTVTTRLAVDHLRSARVRRERYVGPWLPEPVVEDPWRDGARAAELADSVSFAFLVALESLGPVERAALLLHDVFGYGYDEVGAIVERTPAACRQLVARARRRVADTRPRFPVDRARHRALVERFTTAARTGDLDGLVDLLAADVVLTSDGGADRRAARRPIVGVDRVARFVAAIGPRVLAAARSVEPVVLNGEPGFVVRHGHDIHLAGLVDARPDGSGRERIVAVRWIINPDKLAWVDAAADR